MEHLIFWLINFQLGLGRARGLGVELLSHRVVGGHVVSTTFFVRRYASEKEVAHLVATDAHVSQGLVVSRRGRPGFVRAVRVVSYCGTSERVWFAFDVLHSRLFDSYTSIGGAGS